jgi:thioredoxin-like negative regulator of GroEL
VLYFHMEGCSDCAAFNSTSGYTQLMSTGLVTPILNTDARNQQYGVSGYPTVILLKDGKEVGSWEYPNIDVTAILAQINAG